MKYEAKCLKCGKEINTTRESRDKDECKHHYVPRYRYEYTKQIERLADEGKIDWNKSIEEDRLILKEDNVNNI